MNAVAAKGIKFVGHSDLGGKSDGVQIMVHRGYAYVGHMFSKGFSVIDVRDPGKPQAVAYLPAPAVRLLIVYSKGTVRMGPVTACDPPHWPLISRAASSRRAVRSQIRV